jgi:hypothetical protein
MKPSPESFFRSIVSPEHCPSGYSLHLYCKYENSEHKFGEFPHEPADCETYGQAARAARSYGWILHRDRTATCPKCAARLRRGDRPTSYET